MKTVRFIIGPSCAGKTYARQNTPELAHLPYVDLYEVQYELYPDTGGRTEEEIWRSYEVVRDRVLELLDTNDDVILEHTLLKAMRRPYYMEPVREKYPDARFICYYVLPDEREHAYRKRKRALIDRGCEDELDGLREEIENKEWLPHNTERDIFEKPTLAEGFEQVIQLN